MTDPLAIGAALFHDDSLRASTTLTEETIWLFGEAGSDLDRADIRYARHAEISNPFKMADCM